MSVSGWASPSRRRRSSSAKRYNFSASSGLPTCVRMLASPLRELRVRRCERPSCAECPSTAARYSGSASSHIPRSRSSRARPLSAPRVSGCSTPSRLRKPSTANRYRGSASASLSVGSLHRVLDHPEVVRVERLRLGQVDLRHPRAEVELPAPERRGEARCLRRGQPDLERRLGVDGAEDLEEAPGAGEGDGGLVGRQHQHRAPDGLHALLEGGGPPVEVAHRRLVLVHTEDVQPHQQRLRATRRLLLLLKLQQRLEQGVELVGPCM